MRITPEISGASVVLLGHFNPLIFRVDWFAARDIISRQEADDARIEILHEDVSIFHLSSIDLSVQQNRFAAAIVREPLAPLADLVANCFKRLRDTPIRQMGINRLMHFSLQSEEKWHKLGDTLAPKTCWGKFIQGKRGLRKGGLQSLTMEKSMRDDGYQGYLRVLVQPSSKVRNGIFIEVNDHYDLETDRDPIDAEDAVRVLESEWNVSVKRSEDIGDHLVGLVP
jgi:hypothetical protein